MLPVPGSAFLQLFLKGARTLQGKIKFHFEGGSQRRTTYLGCPSSSTVLVVGGASWDTAKSSQSSLKDSGCRRNSRKDGLGGGQDGVKNY